MATRIIWSNSIMSLIDYLRKNKYSLRFIFIPETIDL